MYVAELNSTVLSRRASETDFLKAAAKGDHEAIAWLYNEYGRALFTICRKYADCQETSEDWFQEGFLNILDKLKTFRGDAHIKTWMSRLMVNFCLNKLKEPIRKIEWQTIDHEVEGLEEDEEDVVLETISLEEVLQIMQSMPLGFRLVLNMYALEGRTHAEIAKELKISEGTSKSQLFKARRWIQNQINGRKENDGK